MSDGTTFFKNFLSLTGMILVLLSSPDWSIAGDPQGLTRAMDAQMRHTNRLMEYPGVVGTAVGRTSTGKPAVTIYTERLGVGGLPKTLDGVDVVVKVTGKIKAVHHCKGAHANDPSCSPTDPPDGGDSTPTIDPTARFERPVPIGISAGNVSSIVSNGLFVSCNTGTLGARLTDGAAEYGLSNFHVIALDNNASPGSNIVQPGPADADPVCADNSPTDTIGTLQDHQSITFSTSANNTIDAAIALLDPGDVDNTTPPDGYGIPQALTLECDTNNSCDNLLNTPVQKYGRTTGLTKGTITGVNATILVEYSQGVARFVNQIEVSGNKGGFIKSGDSGALLVTAPDRNPVGLLFAGDRGGKTGFANRIDLVLDRFDDQIPNLRIDGE